MSEGLASSHGRHLIGDFPEIMSMGGEVGGGRPEAVKSGKGAYTSYSSIYPSDLTKAPPFSILPWEPELLRIHWMMCSKYSLGSHPCGS